jgi:ectoine hydroxylase-related dioxygenase (phytanoyl-CoA dioxygenase family)
MVSKSQWPAECLAGTGWIRVHKMQETNEEHLMRTNLDRDGYLLLKNVFPRELVQKAQDEIKSYLISKGFSDKNLHILKGDSPNLLNYQEWIRNQPNLIKVLENENLNSIFKFICSSELVETLKFKWLRAVGNLKYTGLHNDDFYMGYISKDLLTAWIPLQDISLKNGGLIVARTSHDTNSRKWSKIHRYYAKFDKSIPDTNNGWICDDPNELKSLVGERKCKLIEYDWVSCDYEMGDVCILNLDVLHLTAANTGKKWRLSCDTRWIPLDKFQQ